jgi:hypothetical protein
MPEEFDYQQTTINDLRTENAALRKSVETYAIRYGTLKGYVMSQPCICRVSDDNDRLMCSRCKILAEVR